MYVPDIMLCFTFICRKVYLLDTAAETTRQIIEHDIPCKMSLELAFHDCCSLKHKIHYQTRNLGWATKHARDPTDAS